MTINEVQTRLEAIQQENPSMNAVTLFTEETELGTKICFNIMDLQGKPHTFFNDENIDVLNIYDELQARSKKQVNQNQLIGAINRKIHEVRIEAANKSNDENIEVVFTDSNGETLRKEQLHIGNKL